MHGIEFHGEVKSTNASGGVAFTLYEAGSVTARTLMATEWLEITDLKIVRETAGTAEVVADTAAPGRYLYYDGSSLFFGDELRLRTPFVCPQGIVPKLIAASGNVFALIQGSIHTA
jgi:hypothetical protein